MCKSIEQLLKYSILPVILCFSSAALGQKPILNRPLSVSLNTAKHYHTGAIAKNDFYAIEQTGFHAQLAATYRMWEFWGLSLKFDYSIVPMNAAAIAGHFLDRDNTAVSVTAIAGSMTVSQLGLGYYHDFPVNKKAFVRIMPYVGLSILRSPAIQAEIMSTPHRLYNELPGTSTGYFYELQIKPVYSITRELSVNIFLSYAGGKHTLMNEADDLPSPAPVNLSYGRISAGLGVEIAIPWIEMYWKY